MVAERYYLTQFGSQWAESRGGTEEKRREFHTSHPRYIHLTESEGWSSSCIILPSLPSLSIFFHHGCSVYTKFHVPPSVFPLLLCSFLSPSSASPPPPPPLPSLSLSPPPPPVHNMPLETLNISKSTGSLLKDSLLCILYSTGREILTVYR